MSRRGRKRAPTDEAAREAGQLIAAYLEKQRISPAELARQAGVSASATWHALHESPPRWSPTFRKLSEFVNSANDAKRKAPDRAEGFVTRLAQVAGRGGNPSATTAALLRVVADLLETAGRQGPKQ